MGSLVDQDESQKPEEKKPSETEGDDEEDYEMKFPA